MKTDEGHTQDVASKVGNAYKNETVGGVFVHTSP